MPCIDFSTFQFALLAQPFDLVSEEFADLERYFNPLPEWQRQSLELQVSYAAKLSF